MRTHLNASSFELGVKTVHSTLQWRALNRQLQIAKTQREKFFVRQPRPRKRVRALSGTTGSPGERSAPPSGCDCSAAQADQPMREQPIRVAFDQVLLHQAIAPCWWNGTHTV